MMRWRADQSGAMSVLALGASLALLASLTMALGLGSRMLGTRDLQGAVDLAALDAVRALGDLSSATPTALATASLNADEGWIDASLVEAVTGHFDPAAGFTPGGTPANAVRVTGQGEAPGFVLLSDADLTRSAVARLAPPAAALSVGSRLASLDTGDAALLNELFGGLLGGGVSMDVVSYQGLVLGEVTLSALQQELLSAGYAVGSVDQLLAADIGVADLLQATAQVLSNDGTADQVTIDSVTTLQAVTDQSLTVQLGDALNVDTTNPGSVLDAAVNVFDLVNATAQAANGEHTLDLDVPISIPGVAEADMSLTLIEAPQIAIGPPGETAAETAQVRLDLELMVPGLLGGGELARIPLSIDAAWARAALTGLDCQLPSATVDTTTRTAGLYLGDRGATLQPVELIDISVLFLGLITVEGRSQVEVAEGSDVRTVTPPADYTVPGAQAVGLGDLLDSGNIDITTSLLGIPLSLGGILSQLAPVLGPVLDSVDALVTEPLLEALGVGLAGADVSVGGLVCEGRQLVG